jgi:acetyl-CoA synthetase
LNGDINWFANGKLNACYNCLDRFIPSREKQTAIIWEGDEIGTSRYITYGELTSEVCRIANVFKLKGVKKGND